MDTMIAAVHAVAWATYAGGSLTMEWVLRYAQRTMPPSQVGVVCKNAGKRYRWFALVSLMVIGATGGLMVLRLDEAALAARAGSPELSLSDAYGRTLLLLSLCWTALAATVLLMAFWLHPAQRKRSSPEMTSEAIAAERLRVGRAIKQMDRALKFELVMAVVTIGIGASLNQGGLF